jgi:acyl carrier protein
MFRSVKDLDKTWCQEQFQPKVYGVLALEEVLSDRELDFCVLMSSTSAILGGLGFAAYSAANLFMDAWTHKHNRIHPISWISVNWDSWQVGEEKKSADQLGGAVEALSISAGEGARAFQRILSLGRARGFAARIIQSAGDLQTRIDQWIKRESPGKGEISEDEQSVIQEARPTLLSPYAAPGSREEQIMTDTWKELFGYTQVGILDNFFELGGDSLKATTVVSKIHKVLNVQIPLNYFFTNPTIKALAQYIGNTKKMAFSPIIPVEKKEYYPLSSAQKRMFILQQVYRESTGYNLTSAMVVEGDIERKRLEDTSAGLIKRHESYRTSFLLLKGQPVQRIHDQVEFEVEYYNKKEVKVDDSEGTRGLAPLPLESETAFISSFIRPFDLAQAPLLRVGLIKTGVRKYFLVIDTHHIVSDGESQAISVQDFLTLYLREPLPHLLIQYKDFSEWQNPIYEAGQAVIHAQQEHWIKEFNGKIPELDLPLDYPRPAIKSFEGESLAFVIEEELTGKLKELTGKTETTLNMLLLAVYNILLFKYTRQEDIIVGMPVNGRKHTDLQNIVGMFVNMLPIRNQPQGSKTFRSFLMEVKKKVLAALENQDYQFEELVKNLGLERNINTTPLITVVFEMVNFDSEISTIKLARDKLDMKMILEGSAHRNAVFDLILMVGERSGKVDIELVYAKALFKSSAIKKMTQRYISIIRQVVENDEIKLGDIKLSHELRTVKANIFERQSEFGF